MKTYAEKLKDPRWQKKRLKILERDNWKCVVTGDSTETLHVHHRRYFGQPWDAPDEELETVCERVHDVISLFDYPLRKRWPNISLPAQVLIQFVDKAIDLEAKTYCDGDRTKVTDNCPFWHFSLIVWMEMTRRYGDPDKPK